MKVIHLISGGDTGGAKTHVHSLLQSLVGHIDVLLVCFTDGPFAQEAIALGIPTQVLAGHNIVRILAQLRALVCRDGFHIIHCHGARGNLMGAMLHRATGLPVVSTVHSDYRLDYLGRPFSRLTYGTINTLALRCLDYRIGVSDAMTDLLISRGFDPDKLFTIYNGLDFTPRPPAMDRAAFLRSVGLVAEEDSVVVGIAARLNPVKDISTLIRAFAKAYATQPNLRLVIAGDGQEMAALTDLATKLGVAEQVCFAGWVSDVDSFYHALDVNTLTSLSETFPYVLTEGARSALPTVSSRVGGVPYLIDHGVTGLLFSPGDVDALAAHLAALAADPALRRRLGDRLYQKAKAEFSLESTVARQLTIYETVLRRSSRRDGARDGALVCGAYGRGNAGDDAILEAILAELRQLDPDLPLCVLSRSPRETRLTYRVNAVYTFDFIRFLRKMHRTKLYINGGGSLMQDITSRRSLWFYLFTLWAAKKRGNNVLMYGCGIGPIRHPSNRKLAARVLEKYVDVITLRDSHSCTELQEMGVTAPQIVLSADPTVALSSPSREAVDAVIARLGLNNTDKYIAFILRPWSGFEEKAALFAAAANRAYRVHGLIPVFVPIEPRLDVGAARLVTDQIDVPYHVLEEGSSSAQTIGLLSRMTVVVSMRLHGLVFAAGQGIPLVGVVYDQKVSSFLTYIGQDLFTPLEELTEEALNSHIDQACTRTGDDAFLSQGVARLKTIEHRNSEAAAFLLDIPQV